MSRYWSDGYRQDCSGFVSMAWGLGSSQTTWTLPNFAERIGKSDLQPGDVLIYNNAANPQAGSHVTIFGGWADSSQTRYISYEQTSPNTIKRSTPYAYWNNSGSYVPYRYTGLSSGGNGGNGSGTTSNAFPGADQFGPGANNAYVTKLGQMLAQRGGSRFYSEGPGPRWGEADRKATQAFQQAQGWTGSEADGIPGKATWDYLVNGKGRNIDGGGTPLPPPPPTDTNAFPGADKFGPGANNAYVTKLGQMLAQRGGSRFYSEGPGPRWGEADRKATQAFQQAQGWTGSEADGIPGKATWDYLVNGKGRNIDGGGTPLPPPPPTGTTAFPGAQYFAPGQNNDYVRQLGEQLVRKGYGGYYSVGPGPQWGEADRRAVQAFQQAQGWRGSEADGYPGQDTWRRLFS
ncbi:peptidoglycan-binding protein [Kitasatospora sp. SUK 42]|nr:peptidoglycan-binding protein [Kitasatospora sp. SUK 42]